MTMLDERPVWSMSDGELLSALDATQAELDRLQVRRMELAAALDERGCAKELGARDTVQLLSVRHRRDPAEVRRELRLAAALHKYPAVAAALTPTDPAARDAGAAGCGVAASDLSRGGSAGAEAPGTEEDALDADTSSDATRSGTAASGTMASGTTAPDATVSNAGTSAAGMSGSAASDATAPGAGASSAAWLNLKQAATIVDALEKLPASARVPAEDVDVAAQAMVDAGAVLPPDQLRKLGAEVRNRLDTDGPEPAEETARRAETFWLKNADQGVSFGGYLAGENAELLRTLIFAGAKPHKTADGGCDPRTRGRRQADALIALLNTAAGDGSGVPGHGEVKPHITVTIDLNDLRSSTGTGNLVHGDFLSAAAVRRLACDAGVIPLVLGSNSEPLDVGTEFRFVTRAIRQALNARDKGCIVCGAPPAICEAHHVIHWSDGGPTSVNNLALLCKRDHINAHQGRLRIHFINGHPVATRPSWSDPDPPPYLRTAS
ncbi:DUF222 domain-containing protein [Kribbella sp. NPDC048915]|uniref:HNH endonuclease signature motif containing protein n=1 Tax=Kribbella sp. NPDC048915 TaxID=3155148 RepID=UPI0033BFED15